MKHQWLSVLILGLLGSSNIFASVHASHVIPKGVSGTLQVLEKCFEVKRPYRHELVRLENCSHRREQQFTFHENGSITHQGWCLDVPNEYAVNHQPIQLFDCRDQLNQKFATDHLNHLSVQGKCLDVPNSDASCGAKIQLFDCRRQENQSITFHPVD